MQLFGSHFLGFLLAPILMLGGLFGHTPADPPTPTGPVACTLEAKLCPDGSYVGRTGPKCEFTACPTATTTPSKPTPKPTPRPTPTPATSTISIISITPSSGPVGTEVMLSGRFMSTDNIVHFGSGAIAHLPITSSIAIACTTDPSCVPGIRQVIKFTVPESVGPYCKPNMMCPMYRQLVTPGTYKIYVENENGITNTVEFTVTGTATLE